MKCKNLWNALGAAGCALLFAVSMAAAAKPAATHQPAAHKTAAHKINTRAWPAETVSGKITMVDPARNLVVVKGADGTPFDMLVTHSTRIESGSQTLTLSDLASKTSQSASVHFVPERRGDVAKSIQITG